MNGHKKTYQLWARACLQVKRFLTSLHIKLRIKSLATKQTQDSYKSKNKSGFTNNHSIHVQYANMQQIGHIQTTEFYFW